MYGIPFPLTVDWIGDPVLASEIRGEGELLAKVSSFFLEEIPLLHDGVLRTAAAKTPILRMRSRHRGIREKGREDIDQGLIPGATQPLHFLALLHIFLNASPFLCCQVTDKGIFLNKIHQQLCFLLQKSNFKMGICQVFGLFLV